MKPARLAVALALLLSLTACVTLLPDTGPATLYRLTGVLGAETPAAAGPRANVLKGATIFAAAAANDRILTVRGGEVAYVAAARWVEPAPVLFDEAVMRAFEARSARTRLVGYSGAGRADLTLRLEVRDFAAHYEGAAAAPVVVIQVSGNIVRRSTGALLGERVFIVRVPAADNRVAPVVAAFDQALSQVLAEVVRWADGLQ